MSCTRHPTSQGIRFWLGQSCTTWREWWSPTPHRRFYTFLSLVYVSRSRVMCKVVAGRKHAFFLPRFSDVCSTSIRISSVHIRIRWRSVLFLTTTILSLQVFAEGSCLSGPGVGIFGRPVGIFLYFGRRLPTITLAEELLLVPNTESHILWLPFRDHYQSCC